MPELPEVETMVRGIQPHVEGRTITALKKCRCACKPITLSPAFPALARRAAGKTITSVSRTGKRLVLHLEGKSAIVIEPRMTGLMLLADPPDPGHLRLQWRLDGNGTYNSLWFWDRRGLGTVRWFDNRELARELGPDKLGPDALQMPEKDWKARLRGTRRAVKVALLDQRLAAGIGNLYAGEILHAAGIDPRIPCNTLRGGRIGRLHRAVRRVLLEAIEYEGSTLSDATYRNALNRNGRYQNEHRVYNREGELCRSCGKANIERIVQAQRSTFFCPRCQK